MIDNEEATMNTPNRRFVTETDAGFWTTRTLDPTHLLLAECPSPEAADRVSEGLQALTRLCRCRAPQPVPVPVVEELRAPIVVELHKAATDHGHGDLIAIGASAAADAALSVVGQEIEQLAYARDKNAGALDIALDTVARRMKQLAEAREQARRDRAELESMRGQLEVWAASLAHDPGTIPAADAARQVRRIADGEPAFAGPAHVEPRRPGRDGAQ